MGAVSGAVAGGVGEVFKGVEFASKLGGYATKSLAHANTQSLVSAAFSNEVTLGSYAAAFAGSMMASGLQGSSSSFLSSKATMIGASALFGGAVSEITNPDTFWQGFSTSGTVVAANHALHKIAFEGFNNGDPKKESYWKKYIGYWKKFGASTRRMFEAWYEKIKADPQAVNAVETDAFAVDEPVVREGPLDYSGDGSFEVGSRSSFIESIKNRLGINKYPTYYPSDTIINFGDTSVIWKNDIGGVMRRNMDGKNKIRKWWE